MCVCPTPPAVDASKTNTSVHQKPSTLQTLNTSIHQHQKKPLHLLQKKSKENLLDNSEATAVMNILRLDGSR